MSTTPQLQMRKPQPDHDTIRRQNIASDPLISAWVSANAGSGKTYVLSTRVVRLLLDGVDPSKILCLTYTKAAAAEMKNRVFSRLGDWVTMDNNELAKQLSQITGRSVSDAQLQFARTLFARALETPGGLKVQTIHAFCESLLHRFPLEANIAGHFELLDEVAAGFLITKARRKLLTEPDDEIRAALGRVLLLAGEAGLEKLLGEIVDERQELGDLIGRFSDARERSSAYLTHFDFETDVTAQSLKESIWNNLPLDIEMMRGVRDEAAALGKTRACKYSYGLVNALENTNSEQAFDALKDKLIKDSGEPYSVSWVFAKDILNKYPSLAEDYQKAAENMSVLNNRINLLDEITNTLDALTIADHLLSLYSKMKNARGLLDFDDLITRTQSMLHRENVAAWVRYKLDQGIDHLLVDEAQDTSPAQWRVIKALADEFFDGESAAGDKRTIFAVGDEKQSIYSFQGADPRGFDEQRLHFKLKVKHAEREFEDLRLNTSFRSTQDVLSAVDLVFEPAEIRRGLTGADDSFPPHISLRQGEPGAVQVWDMKKAEDVEEEEDWRKPVDHAAKPAVVVAERVAGQIKRWLDENAYLDASGKPIDAGDILVLVRKRDAFVHALSRALKNRDIPVAGADRLSMVSHIAIMDLIALGRVMLNNSDDLSLAALLRSPIFSWSDQQLFDLAYDRGSLSLYEKLKHNAGTDQASAEAVSQLSKWMTAALQQPVFEFYSHVLGVGRVREKLISRLGPATAEMLDEFLGFAIAQERTGTVALETFLNTLENFSPVIKREMDDVRQEVRIMTVHGAKGLEAPIVFLVDPGSPAFASQNAPALLPITLQDGAHSIGAVLWGNSGSERSTEAKAVLDGLRQAAEEEYRRLLYVGMTRAADRLIVVGYQGKKDKTGIWHHMVSENLQNQSQTIELDGFSGFQYPANQALERSSPQPTPEQLERSKISLPEFFDTPAPVEPPAARPLTPSGAYGYAIEPNRQDSDGEAPASLLATFSDAETHSQGPQLAMRRGTVVHRLLQMLPALPPEARRQSAETFCKSFESRWTAADIDHICAQVFGVLDNPDFAAFFDQNSRAEISVMGTLNIGDQERAVSGVIDRLSVTDKAVYLVDYKTNASPPRSVEQIPDVYLRQMALYHALVAPLYPDRPVVAALLFTASSSLFVLDDRILQQALESMAPVA